MEIAVDWGAIIQRLERRLTHTQIGAKVGRTESWVGQLKRGFIKEPPHSVGEALKALDVISCVSCETEHENGAHE